MEKGKELKDKSKEKMSHLKEGVMHRVEEFETRFEEKGLGPVTGVESSVESSQTPHRVGAESDAAIGSVNRTAQPRPTGMPIEPIDSESVSSTSFSSSPSEGSPPAVDLSPLGSNVTSNRSGKGAEGASISGGVATDFSMRGEEQERSQQKAPQFGMSKPQSSLGSKPQEEGEAVILAPVDAVISQPSASSSASTEGIDGPPTEHAAQVQRNEGMTSDELLGTEAIGKGKSKGKEKERMEKNARATKSNEEGAQSSRPHQ